MLYVLFAYRFVFAFWRLQLRPMLGVNAPNPLPPCPATDDSPLAVAFFTTSLSCDTGSDFN